MRGDRKVRVRLAPRQNSQPIMASLTDDFPIDISFQNLDHSDAVEANIRKKIATMERFFDRIVYCRVAVSAPHKHSHRGRTLRCAYQGLDPWTKYHDQLHEDVYVAIRDAFSAAVWNLEGHARKVHGDVKRHANDQECLAKTWAWERGWRKLRTRRGTAGACIPYGEPDQGLSWRRQRCLGPALCQSRALRRRDHGASGAVG